METAGLVLAVVSEVRTIAKSLQERIACFKEEKHLVAEVDNALSCVNHLSSTITNAMKDSPKAIPEYFLATFEHTLANVKVNLAVADAKLEHLLVRVFPDEGVSSSLSKAWKKAKQIMRAKSVTKELCGVLSTAEVAGTTLQLQLTQLLSAVKTDGLEGKMQIMIENYRLPVDVFQPVFNTPAISPKIRLDFDARDECGNFSTPEGRLRHCVFASSATETVTVAKGSIAGAGKTTALLGLGHDPAVKSHFVHGVIFFSDGAAASEKSVAKELAKVMDRTGGFSKAAEVESAVSFSEAVSVAGMWLSGRRILLIIDDIRPTPGRPLGYLTDLVALLEESPDSRIAISVRNVAIAVRTGAHVEFCARDPQGRVATAMFMSHAIPGVEFGVEHVQAARRILHLCGGLPIALALTGDAVSFRVRNGLAFETACETFCDLLADAMHSGVRLLDASISLNLDSLQEWANQNEKLKIPYSFQDLYGSLCVLENQQQARVSVLRRMWKVDESPALEICLQLSSMSLAQLSADEQHEVRLRIHGVQLDFVRRMAGDAFAEWHRRSEGAKKRLRCEVYIEALEIELTARHREGEEMRSQLEQAQAEAAKLRALAGQKKVKQTSTSQTLVVLAPSEDLRHFPTDPDDPDAAIRRLLGGDR